MKLWLEAVPKVRLLGSAMKRLQSFWRRSTVRKILMAIHVSMRPAALKPIIYKVSAGQMLPPPGNTPGYTVPVRSLVQRRSQSLVRLRLVGLLQELASWDESERKRVSEPPKAPSLVPVPRSPAKD